MPKHSNSRQWKQRMAKSLALKVLTPAEILLDVPEVAWVQAQLADGGCIGIWPGHAPLLAQTVKGLLRYAETAETDAGALDLEAGILQIDRQGVMIFTSGLATTESMPDQPAYEQEARFERLTEALSRCQAGREAW